ncbi:MAG: STAS domain-containing protein [Aeromicrobium sp.]|uniref:STAS domain-containing protein n=1 Tax=Aeromicrobium sp. TaxID=1871063 RepID=UPI00262BA644|nr:STAS domain-containing protein [Aeromicrobium sp.]MDF1706186.1 STAS domain-containing protein [Aeromicrobium sp.]
MEQPELVLEVVVDEHHVTVAVAGDIDLLTAEKFRDFACDEIAAHPRPAVIDMTGVGFVDSSGISALVAIRRQAEALGVSVVVEPSRRVQAALKLAGLTEIFHSDDPDDSGTGQPA